MNRKYIILLVIIGALISIAMLINRREDRLKKQGQVVINKVDNYKTTHGYYPKALNEIGIKSTEEGPLFYERKDSLGYILYFGTSLGESKVYYPDTRTWEEGFRLKKKED